MAVRPHYTTVTAVGAITQSTDPRVIGDYVPLKLACGHDKGGNPSMHYTVGERTQCWSDEHTAASV